MDRDEFMNFVYDELYSDGDNNRANRIIDAADEYVESAQLGTNLADVSTDTISRQAAIEAIKAKRLWHGQYLTNSTAGYDYAIEVLKELPSVQSKPLTGNWIKVTNTLCKCDRCGAVQLKGHFCKDCGAKMEV